MVFVFLRNIGTPECTTYQLLVMCVVLDKGHSLCTGDISVSHIGAFSFRLSTQLFLLSRYENDQNVFLIKLIYISFIESRLRYICVMGFWGTNIPLTNFLYIRKAFQIMVEITRTSCQHSFQIYPNCVNLNLQHVWVAQAYITIMSNNNIFTGKPLIDYNLLLYFQRIIRIRKYAKKM